MKRLSEYRLPFKYDTSYAYAAGRIRALETRLLTRQDFTRLVAAENIESLFRILSETDYGQMIAAARDPEGFEEQLHLHLASILDLIGHLSKDPEVTNVLKSRYDYFNVKVLLKAKAANHHLEEILFNFGLIDPAELSRMIEGEEPGHLPASLRRTIETAAQFLTQGIHPQEVDVFVDKEMFGHHLSVLKRAHVPFLWGWMEREIDLANIKTFFRLRWTQEVPELLKQSLCKGGSLDIDFFRVLQEETQEAMSQRFGATRYAALVEEGISFLQTTGSFARLEQLCDGTILSYLHRTIFATFSVELLVAYALIKEYEIKALRTVAVGTWNRIPQESIRERLPDAYI